MDRLKIFEQIEDILRSQLEPGKDMSKVIENQIGAMVHIICIYYPSIIDAMWQHDKFEEGLSILLEDIRRNCRINLELLRKQKSNLH